MDSFFGFDGINNGIASPAAFLAWQVFMNTGEPGMYMFYKDLTDEDDERFE